MSLKPNSNKSLSNILYESFVKFARFMNSVKIGQIQSFNSAQQTATVQIMHKERNEYSYSEDELIEYPLLEEVPVIIMGGGGTYISHPINTGDYCLLLFCDNNFDSWWISGEARPSDFPRRHNLSDAIAIVGLNPITSLIQAYSTYLCLHYSDSSNIIIGEQIDINNSQVKVNGNLTVSQTVVGNSTITGEIHSTHGATGSFSNAAGQTLTIQDGVITAIS